MLVKIEKSKLNIPETPWQNPVILDRRARGVFGAPIVPDPVKLS